MNIKSIKIKPDVLFQEVSDETVLLNLQNESYFGLDETGTRFWQLLQEDNGMQEIINILLTEYDVEPVQLESDLNNLVNNMLAAELVEVSES